MFCPLQENEKLRKQKRKLEEQELVRCHSLAMGPAELDVMPVKKKPKKESKAEKEAKAIKAKKEVKPASKNRKLFNPLEFLDWLKQ